MFRQVEPKDYQAIWELHNRALEDTGAHGGNGEWDEDVRDPDASYLKRGGNFLVLEVHGRVAAMGAYVPVDASTVEIRRMRVEPAVQGTGIGKKPTRGSGGGCEERGFFKGNSGDDHASTRSPKSISA